MVFELYDISFVLLVFLHLYFPYRLLISIVSWNREEKNSSENSQSANYINIFKNSNYTFVLTNSKSNTFIIFVLTYSSICKISIVWISVKPFCCNASQHRWTCSIHGENEQNRPPEIEIKKNENISWEKNQLFWNNKILQLKNLRKIENAKENRCCYELLQNPHGQKIAKSKERTSKDELNGDIITNLHDKIRLELLTDCLFLFIVHFSLILYRIAA